MRSFARKALRYGLLLSALDCPARPLPRTRSIPPAIMPLPPHLTAHSRKLAQPTSP